MRRDYLIKLAYVTLGGLSALRLSFDHLNLHPHQASHFQLFFLLHIDKSATLSILLSLTIPLFLHEEEIIVPSRIDLMLIHDFL